jgi:pilus assembly protein CpaF
VSATFEMARMVREHVLAESPEAASVTPLEDRTANAIEQVLHEKAMAGEVFTNEAELRGGLSEQLYGFGVLQSYLLDAQIEEIWINRPHQVFIARNGSVDCISVDLDASTVRTLVLRMLRSTGRRIDTSLPFADAILPDGSRLHVVIPDVTAQHWSVNIRKFPAQILTLSDLTAGGMLTAAQSKYLTDAALAGKNILVSGATHTGKTTLLTALLDLLPQTTRLVSCEETFELRSNLRDWVAMQARQPNLEGQGEIPLRRLVKEALRMRPERLVIGEVREAEALDLLIAMNSGVSGACTIHANSAAAAITKLCTLPLLAGPNISAEFVRRTVSDAVDVVVHCEYLADGSRRVREIASVEAGADGTPTTTLVDLP